MDDKTVEQVVAGLTKDEHPPRCADYDNDCPGFDTALACWLYDPMKGYCPFLRQQAHLKEQQP